MNMVQLGMSAENVTNVLDARTRDILDGKSIDDGALRIVWNTKKPNFVNNLKTESLVWTNAPTRSKKARKLSRS